MCYTITIMDGRAPLRPVREDEAHGEMLDLLGEMRPRRLRLARLLARLDASRHYLREGHASIGGCGESHGLSAREARTLASVGRVLRLCPGVESSILAGRVSFEAAASL